MDEAFKKEMKKASKEYNEALQSGDLKKSNENKKFSGFFFSRSENSLLTADLLYQISNNQKDKSNLRIDESYESFMWIIVVCYYSMFYMASALIANKGIKAGHNDVHRNVKNAFLRLYIENSSLEKVLGIDYTGCKEIAEDLMQERERRSRYQYDIGEGALRRDAEMSIRRARNFFEKTRKILE